MSVLIETPSTMDFVATLVNNGFVSTSTSCSIRPLDSRKRKCSEIVDDISDGYNDLTFEGAPKKLLRREISIEDVRNCDVCWSFPMDSNAQYNLECSFSDNCLHISSRRADNRLQRRCLSLPDYVDQNSICLCFDSNNFLLIGFNFLHGFRIIPSVL